MRRLIGTLVLVGLWLSAMTVLVFVLHHWDGKFVFKVMLAASATWAAGITVELAEEVATWASRGKFT